MAIVISGVNNNDMITASDGSIDLLSGVNFVSEVTVPSFKVGSDIQFGNAGIITATTLVGNVTGNINHTSNLLLQISGSEKFRVASSGQLGIGGANYGSAGQVLTSGGSGSAATWSTITGTTINNNAANRIITGEGGTTLNGEANLTFDGSNVIHAGGDGRRYSFAGGGSSHYMKFDSTLNGIILNGYGGIAFETNGTNERVRIQSNGFVGIGTDNAVNPLEVWGSSVDLLLMDTQAYSQNVSGSAIAFQGYDSAGSRKTLADVRGVANGQNRGEFAIRTRNTSGQLTETLRITSAGNMALGNSDAAKKFHISTTGNQKVLIDPNYANNSGGSSNSEANAGNIVESILIRTSYGDNAGSSANAGHKWGIKFQGYNGNSFTQASQKTAAVYAVSEDDGAGYNRQVGLAIHTSPYDSAHREVMRINTNGIVTKPYQYVFMVATGGASKAANWSKVTGLAPVSAQCTGVSDGTYWSNSNQQFTAPVTGVYHFYVGGWATPNSNGTRYAYSFRHTNGNNLTYIGGGDYCSGDSPMAGWSRTIKLTAGEWVELWMYSAISATLGGGHYFYWGGYLLG